MADDEPGGLTREERCDVKDLHLINRDLLASMLQVSSGPLQLSPLDALLQGVPAGFLTASVASAAASSGSC
ncbi:MAG TPA: hypothetical protein VMQ99_11725 [Acetobacteraceae bacterium]|nr:hypothetical protein [Acetobacteraceae bacterium]